MLFSKKQKQYPKLQAGDVIFFEPADLMGQVIRIFTWSKYSHAGIAVDSENMLEAQTAGVRIVPLSLFLPLQFLFLLHGVCPVCTF